MGIKQSFITRYKLEKPVHVTQPSMPKFRDYTDILKKIWRSRLLTNYGKYHQELNKKLAEFMGVKYCSLFANGTLALLIGMKALKIKGEVITTPFTFPATAHVLDWLSIKPVFCDIESRTFTIDVSKIRRLITRRTSAILGVHVYGNPCDVYEIQSLADEFGLKVVYDAAHTFGEKFNGKSLMNYGDVSMVSFHATKLFTTLEGGALVVKNRELKDEIDHLKNFGITDEEHVIRPGINAKMNEFQAAFGIVQLKIVKGEIAKRKKIASLYKRELSEIAGILVPGQHADTEYNYGYFPVLVKKGEYGMSRDQLYLALKKFNINARKYFYPLVSSYPHFKNLSSAKPGLLPVAEQIAREILCLPIYGNLPVSIVGRICAVIKLLGSN